MRYNLQLCNIIFRFNFKPHLTLFLNIQFSFIIIRQHNGTFFEIYATSVDQVYVLKWNKNTNWSESILNVQHFINFWVAFPQKKKLEWMQAKNPTAMKSTDHKRLFYQLFYFSFVCSLWFINHTPMSPMCIWNTILSLF